MNDKLSAESHPIIIETWCKTNGCRADVYRQETRRLNDEKRALEQRAEGLERIKSAFEYLAIESESGVIETEAAEDGSLLSRAEHDKRIARFVRETLAAEEEQKVGD